MFVQAEQAVHAGIKKALPPFALTFPAIYPLKPFRLAGPGLYQLSLPFEVSHVRLFGPAVSSWLWLPWQHATPLLDAFPQV